MDQGRTEGSRRAGEEKGSVSVKVDDARIVLSPGKHNLLEKLVVEVFAPIFIDGAPKVLLLSDAEHKLKHVDPLAQAVHLKLDEHEKMPDVILYSATRNILYIVEAVISAGPISEPRVRDIERIVLPDKLTFGVEYFTAFPDRTVFRKFLDEIAWGT